jgi:hypothetical protein
MLMVSEIVEANNFKTKKFEENCKILQENNLIAPKK